MYRIQHVTSGKLTDETYARYVDAFNARAALGPTYVVVESRG